MISNKTLLLATAVAAAGFAATAPAQEACPDISLEEPAGVRLDPVTRSDEAKACLVTGRMAEHQGQDGNSYAIRFEIALPDAWNGNFVHQFNGGADGNVVPARGGFNVAHPDQTALARGFAVVSSDAGHDMDAHPDQGLQGPSQFGFDATARADYGHAAVAKLDPVARRIVEAAYGAPIRYSYGIGRSNGGRHAMVAASRLPEAFDGFLVGYPGFNLPKAAIQHAWDAQIFHGLTGDIRTAFSQQELDVLSSGVLDQCDRLDRLEDGMIFAFQTCQAVFDPDRLACEGDGCLPPAKVDALKRMMAGPHTTGGAPLYSGWYWDSGMNSANWRQWKLEGPEGAMDRMPRIVAMGSPTLAQVFSTPPVTLGTTAQDMLDHLLGYDFDRDPALLAATTEDFPESSLDAMIPPDLSFAGFREAGGKMIVYHGISDPVFSAQDTVSWYRDAPRADSYSRLYLVPGMPHGHDPNAASDFDLLSALVNWVEHGVAPGAVEARTRPEEGAGVSRLLCPYPTTAIYVAGDPALATSFSCQTEGAL
ncbi:tannase/feruloyl esterase family alpha/beta hydrolase [Falsirhodobacter deserti]|uniref:tannase/feruloyl esterase family alpha/beta hydrolase n=1 Tax=Falsirhodobacter deserti TaxID=1365611 RepID=UPI000FE306F4|nr:tannase/feruloyl esterase family alpha/beta hydrolase [Falsirhodobacter deserti]